MAAVAGSSRRGAEDREAAKVRRQKIFVGIGGGILLVVVAFELLPALFGSSSSGSGSPAPAAAPVTPAVAAIASGSSTPRISRSVARLATRDVFKPQLSTSVGGGAGAAVTAVISKGPSVRLKKFVAKDVFVPQIKAAAATPASTSVSQATESQGSSASHSAGASGAGFIIVVASIPGIGPASERAAARALVAARNAGLKEVTANDAVPGTSGSAPHFTIYTGPYQYESSAQAELKRALRNGYPHARAQQLPSTSGKGF